MYISVIELFEALAELIGKEKAKVVVTYVENKVEKHLNEKTTVFATKEDIANLQIEIANSKVEMIKWVIATGLIVVGLVITAMRFML